MFARSVSAASAASVAALLAVTLVSAPAAVACTCTEPPPVADALAQSAAVFAGIPRSVELIPDPHFPLLAITFEVTAVWKGAVPAELVLYTAQFGASCGIEFELDVEWLVYSFLYPIDPVNDPGNLEFSAHSCSRTARAAGNPDLDELGPPLTTPTPGSWGHIKAAYR